MNRWITGVLLLAAALVFTLFCVTIIDEREQGFRTLLNQAEPKLFGVALNRPNLVEPGWYIVIPGLHELVRYDRRNILFNSSKRSLNTVERTLVDADYAHGLVFKRSGLAHDDVPRYYFGRLLATSGLPAKP